MRKSKLELILLKSLYYMAEVGQKLLSIESINILIYIQVSSRPTIP